MTSSVVGQRRSSKALPTAKLALKNSHVWWSAASLIHYSFLNPRATLHLRNMLRKLMRCTKNCNTCSQHWSERAQFSMTTPDCTSHNHCVKSWKNWATKRYLICHFHLTSRQPTTTSSSIFTTFCRENASTTAGGKKNAFKELVESWSTDFYATGINKVMVLIFINEDVFEPS